MKLIHIRCACLTGAILALILLNLGCGDRAESVYQEKAPLNAQPSLGSPGNPPTASDVHPQTPQLSWTVPVGWKEVTASGMRLASFQPLPGDDTLQCSLVPLQGDAGGLYSNVVRWLGQMQRPVPSEEILKTFLATQEKWVSIGGLPVQVVDLSSWEPKGKDGDMAILAAIITIDKDTLFVKLTGPQAAVMAQKKAFMELCRSLKTGE